ncbi:MAG: hypothetical protein JST64_02115 [Actinobacteria bacterium]|nr:hypothetical protein [Actinomycetota bacterium]
MGQGHPDAETILMWIANHDDSQLVDLANLWHGYSYLGTLSAERSARYDTVLDELVADGTLVRTGDRYIGFSVAAMRDYALSWRDAGPGSHAPTGVDRWWQEHIEELMEERYAANRRDMVSD